MKMETGQWYLPRYSGRRATLYRVKHITGSEIIMELWEFDKKEQRITLVDKYVPMDEEYFRTKSESEELVSLSEIEYAIPDLPQ